MRRNDFRKIEEEGVHFKNHLSGEKLNKIIEFLEDADVKVGGIHIADYIADVGILY